MYDNEFFVVDLASCQFTGEIINSLSLALETLNHSGKKIVLKLSDTNLSQSQLLSIQSLITSYGCTLDTIETTNEEIIAIAKNMGILIQKPVEKRTEEVPINDAVQEFTPFEIAIKKEEKESDLITLKDVNGLHFEADLDAIQKQQDSIDISKDLRQAGIEREQDFDTIEEQITSKFPGFEPEELIKKPENNAINENKDKGFEEFKAFYSENTKITSIKEPQETEEKKSKYDKFAKEFETDFKIGYKDEIREEAKNELNNIIQEEEKIPEKIEELREELKEELMEEKPTIESASAKEDLNKNSISIYKKAYDDKITEEHWEEVDFLETPTTDPIVSDTKETAYINQTLRSGQILEAEGNVVIIGDCHPGSEIRAIGDITVWGVLSGVAHAGCKGNLNAKVRALKMNAVQLRIGNCYSRRPDSTNIPYIIRSSVFTPEEARAVDGEIMLFKINQN